MHDFTVESGQGRAATASLSQQRKRIASESLFPRSQDPASKPALLRYETKVNRSSKQEHLYRLL